MRTVPIWAALLLLAAGCGGAARANGRTSVVAAFYPLAFVAEQVGGPQVDVRNLTPAGAEPHDIELSPKDVGRLQSADFVLYLSHGFQPAVEQAVDGAHGTRVDALAGIPLRQDDPHVWLDPLLFTRVVRRVGAALHGRARAAALARRVLALDREYRDGLAHCERRDFVTTHAAFGYLAVRYRLHEVAITGVDPESEPDPRRVQELIRLVRREHVSTVFFERLVSPRLAETIARDGGAQTAVLDPIEGLTADERAQGATYFTLMRRNLHELRKALGCR